MNNIFVIFLKQIKDTVKNKTVLIQFLMFPLITVIMENTVKISDMPEHFFANLFAVMFVGMAPLTCTSAIVAEEKEKNTLRVLLMSKVRPMEYLIGVGGYVFTLCAVGVAIIGLAGGYSGGVLARFMLYLIAGTLISITVGAAIGIWSKSQMSAAGVVVPVMMVLSFLPMLSMFNDKIAKVSELTYSGQLSVLIGSIEAPQADAKTAIVLSLNAAAAVVAFKIAYKNSKME